MSIYNKTVLELKDLCKKKKIKITSKMKKQDLIDILNESSCDETILNDSYNIEKIYHISDIHVKFNNDRDEEYKSIFYKFIEVIKDKKDIAVAITGDTFDKKNSLTPESVFLIREFLTNIGKICPVFIILGNHDTFLQQNCMDSLTPVLHLIPNVYYLKYSGMYQFGNIIFAVSSLLDGKITKIENKKEGLKYISLYHGTIGGSKVNIDFKGEKYAGLSDFGNYDFLLLGDIHKMQFFGENAAYPGSLIQQNFGESIQNHGYIEWDINNGTGTFHEIQNEYAFLTVTFKGKDIIYEGNIDHIKNVYLRAFFPDNDKQRFLASINKLKERFNVLYYREEYSVSDLLGVEIKKHKSRNELILQILKEKNISNDDIQKVLAIDKDLGEDIQETIKPRWIIKDIKFKNVFIYSGDKEYTIDFTKGFIKIFGENAIGKSTIPNIITFGLFGEDVNDVKLYDIPHNGNNNNLVEINFQVADKIYNIKRAIKINKEQGIIKGRYSTCLLSSDEKEIANGAKNVSVKINELIGSYSDFELTSLISNKHIGLLQHKPIDRLKVVRDLLKLDKYKEIEDKIKLKIKELNIDLNKNEGALELLANINTHKINENIIELEIKEKENLNLQLKETDKVTQKLNKYNQQLEKLNTELYPFSDSIEVVEKQIDEINNCDMIIEDTDLIKDEIKSNYQQIKNISKCEDKMHEIIKLRMKEQNNKKDITRKIEELSQFDLDDTLLQSKHHSLLHKIKELYKLKTKVNNVEDPTEQLNKVTEEYHNLLIVSDDLTKKCFELNKNLTEEITQENINIFIEKKEKIKEFVDNIQENTNVLITSEIKNNLIEILNKVTLEENYQYQNINKQIKDLNLDQKKNLIDRLTEQKEKYNENLKIISENESIQKEINELEKEEKVITDKISSNYSNKTLLTNLKIQLLQIENNEGKLSILEKQQVMYNEYIIAEENNKKINENIKELELKVKIIESKNEKKIKLTQKLEKLKEIHGKLLENQKYLEQINQVKNKISQYNTELSDINEYNNNIKIQKVIIENEISKIKNNIELYEKELNQKRELINQITKIKDELKIYDIYLQLIKVIPGLIVNEQIPVLEDNINNLLSLFTKFKVKITIDDKEMNFRYLKPSGNDITIKSCSGYETFILNLALKYSLSQFGYLAQPSFISIDEGWDVISESNYDKLEEIFNILYKKYNNILVISHLPKIQQMLNQFEGFNINIKKIGEYSEII